MRKNKINRADVIASQNARSPSCGYPIHRRRFCGVSTEQMKCPKCGRVFEPEGNDGARRLATIPSSGLSIIVFYRSRVLNWRSPVPSALSVVNKPQVSDRS